jgi:hypothetical protein
VNKPHAQDESTGSGKTGSPHVKWMSVVAVGRFRASRLLPAGCWWALQRSSEVFYYTKNVLDMHPSLKIRGFAKLTLSLATPGAFSSPHEFQDIL